MAVINVTLRFNKKEYFFDINEFKYFLNKEKGEEYFTFHVKSTEETLYCYKENKDVIYSIDDYGELFPEYQIRNVYNILKKKVIG